MTDEAEDVVDKWFASKKPFGYPIAILDGKLEQSLGVPHYPYSGVMDPSGTIVYAGDSPEGALKKAMKSAKAAPLWPKKLADAVGCLRQGKLGEAWVAIQGLKKATDLSDYEQKVLGRFETFTSDSSASAVKLAQDLVKKDLVYQAVRKVEAIASANPPLPASEDAKKVLGELKALPAYEAEMKGGDAYAAGLSKEDEKDFVAAVNLYKDVAKKAEGTKIAGVAISRAKELIAHGMPGYSPVCEKCKRATKACAKHAKPMKV